MTRRDGADEGRECLDKIRDRLLADGRGGQRGHFAPQHADVAGGDDRPRGGRHGDGEGDRLRHRDRARRGGGGDRRATRRDRPRRAAARSAPRPARTSASTAAERAAPRPRRARHDPGPPDRGRRRAGLAPALARLPRLLRDRAARGGLCRLLRAADRPGGARLPRPPRAATATPRSASRTTSSTATAGTSPTSATCRTSTSRPRRAAPAPAGR